MPLGGQHDPQNPPKTRPKSMENRWKMDIKNDKNFECILKGFLVALGANMAPKPSQNTSKIDGKSMKNGHQKRWKFWMHFEWLFGGSWGQHGPKTLPKPYPNRWKIYEKSISKSIKILHAFWMAFWWLLGPTWPQKPPKRKPGWDGKVLLFLGLEGSWAVLGPLEAQELILTVFWLIFNGFW